MTLAVADASDSKTNSRYQLKNKTNTKVKKKKKEKKTIGNQKSKINILKFSTTVAIIIYVSLYSVSLNLRM